MRSHRYFVRHMESGKFDVIALLTLALCVVVFDFLVLCSRFCVQWLL